jgi:hypothetical protein
MSVIRCDKCSRLIDSDEDLECFIQVIYDGATWDAVRCEVCRDREEEMEVMLGREE